MLVVNVEVVVSTTAHMYKSVSNGSTTNPYIHTTTPSHGHVLIKVFSCPQNTCASVACSVSSIYCTLVAFRENVHILHCSYYVLAEKILL